MHSVAHICLGQKAVKYGPQNLNPSGLAFENLVFPTFPHFFLSKLNFVALVRKRTAPTERLPLVGEVSTNFSG
jgi:hypothetical protein